MSHGSTPSPPLAPADVPESLDLRRRAFLLHQLDAAPEGILSQSAANKAIPKQLKAELRLPTNKVANDLRGEMVASGWLTQEKLNRVVTYSITDVGRQHLRGFEQYVPLLPAKGNVNPPPDGHTRRGREAYVLDALARADGRTMTKADAAALGSQHCLQLNPATVRSVLTDLAARGDVRVQRAGGTESYALTPSGEELLNRLRGEFPVLPPTGKPTPAPSESVRQGREAYILLKLLQSVKYALWASDAAAGSYPKPLKLNHATAWQVRGELVRQGHISVSWDGKEGCYTLTPSGKRYLATLPFDALGEVKVRGSALTELLTAAREDTKSTAGPTTEGTHAPAAERAPTETELDNAVLDVFHELLRGPYANLRMVPIHEIRRRVAERFGANAVSHVAFDERLLDLRRTDRVNLVSIDDRSRATADQLRDSIFAVGETFFYVEKAHVPA